MGQRVIGLDVGSHSVKVAVFNASFRSFELEELVERPVASTAVTPWSDEWLASLQVILSDLRRAGILTGETIVTALPGDKLSSRILTLPFTESKQIDSTLGFELENFLPYSADDIVYDYIVLEKMDAQTKLMAFAVERQSFDQLLEVLQSAGIDPRFVGVGSLTYLHLLKHLPDTTLGPIAIVDIGAHHTDIAVFDGASPELVRTVLRGGYQVTEAIANALGTDVERAEQVKQDEGLVATASTPFIDDRQSALAEAARSAIDPLVQRIHMTLQARLTHVEEQKAIRRLYLCGGGSELRNLYDYLEQALQIPTEPLPLGSIEWNRVEGENRNATRFAKAIANGIRATSGATRDDINFRRGTFAYKGDFAYLQGKLAYLAMLVIVLVGVAGFKAYLRYEQLNQQLDGQYAALEEFSTAVLGKPAGDFSRVLEDLKKLPDEESMAVFPEITASRALYDITSIMVDVGNTTRAEVLALRGESAQPGAPEGGPTAGPGSPVPLGAQPGAGEARDPSAPIVPAMPPGVDPLFPDGPPGMRPPGPGPSRVPGLDADTLREERARRLREFRERRAATMENAVTPEDTAERVRGMPVTRPITPGIPRRITPAPALGGGIREGIVRGHVPAVNEVPKEDPTAVEKDDDAGTDEPEKKPAVASEERLQLELELVTVDNGQVSLKGEANSIEAATLFEQKLRKHPCFQEVFLEGTERITFERHRNWYSFRMAMQLDCQTTKDERTNPKEGG